MRRLAESPGFFAVAAVISVALKWGVSQLGDNYDMGSWVIVADHMLAGDPLYLSTAHHYNYGPFWAFILDGLRWWQLHILPDPPQAFHGFVAIFLALVDVAMAWTIGRLFSPVARVIFLCNPVSILLSGFHAQFDNLAVWLGLLGVAFLAKSEAENDDPRLRWRGGLLLGVSLVFKHIFLFFPFWLLMRQGRWSVKLARSAIPLLFFVLCFLPFALSAEDRAAIATNVIAYGSVAPEGFYAHLLQLFLPVLALDAWLQFLPVVHGFKAVFLATLLLTGWRLRHQPMMVSSLFYLIALCVFSSTMTDQYLAIPLAACAVFYQSSLCWIYVGTTTLVLMLSSSNIGQFPPLSSWAKEAHALGVMPWQPLSFLFLFLMQKLFERREQQVRLVRPPELGSQLDKEV